MTLCIVYLAAMSESHTLQRRMVGWLSSNELYRTCKGPPLWSTAQSSWLQIQRSWVPFPALPDFLRSSGSGTGSAQPRKDN
jgi:hypothetical protein